jgi:hypothetical protein
MTFFGICKLYFDYQYVFGIIALVGGTMSDSFKSMYDDALRAYEEFQGHAIFVFRAYAENSEFSSLKASFRLSQDYYKTIVQTCNDLTLWHTAKVEGKNFKDWTEKDRAENILVRALLRTTSSLMCSLQDIYGPALAKNQSTAPLEFPSKE